MSFLCQNPTCTRKTQPNGVRPIHVVTKMRERVYTRTVNDEKTGEDREIMIGRGSEIVKEISCCLACANRISVAQRAAVPAEVPDFAAMEVRVLASPLFDIATFVRASL